MRAFAQPLPIDDALPALCAALAARNVAVLVAPPGAGKTTRVPLALLDEPFTAGGRIIMLEPRRLAARAAARRMAATLGENVGETIGLRVRLQSLIGPKTRVEVVTEGVFARMILDDPELTGIAAVLFDEYHERSLDADLGLALALDSQGALREDLRILVMSATLEGARVAKLMGDAPLITSQGRAYPVVTRYVGRDPNERIDDAMARVILGALRDETGSILAFLPGQGEILRLARQLEARVQDANVDVAPLYGALSAAEQDFAVAPAKPGRRKIVLATSIAETSLTIEGVRVVVDGGLMRAPVFEPDLGLTRLETRRVALANADQRRGRAGRVEPGVCYRLWEEAANGGMSRFAPPEILAADLSSFALDLAAWGVADSSNLRFLDPPPEPALKEARKLLADLGALDANLRLTDEGRAMRRLPLAPRLARMVVDAARAGQGVLAAEIAVLVTERGLGGDAVDAAARLDDFRRDRSPRADDARRLAKGIAQGAGRADGDGGTLSVGALLAAAFPDRIAMARGKRGEFLMANGRAASLERHEALAGADFLAVGEIVGRAGAQRILTAAPLTLAEIERAQGHAIMEAEEIGFDLASASLRARRRRRLGALVLSDNPLAAPTDEVGASVFAKGIVSLGSSRWPWSKAVKQWRDRVAFLRRAESGEWPDLSDAALETSPDWLAPFVLGKTRLDQLGADELHEALKAQLPYALHRRLEAEAPTHFTAPTGTAAAVDYESEGGPSIALRVQELFGLATHPSLADGRVPLTLHLLSPAHRPIQITKDLPGFWRGSWSGVRADLRGRYPRHSWPEDPAGAAPTTRAKPRGT